MQLKIIVLIILLLIMLVYLIMNVFFYNNIDTFISNNKKYKEYRLGDLISGYIYKNQPDVYKSYNINFPNTIASKYINSVKNKPTNDKHNNINVLYEVLDIKGKDKNGINLHLRLGDSIKDYKNNKYIFYNSSSHKYGVQPNVYDKLCKIIKEKTDNRNINVYYGSHNHFNQYSLNYLNDVKTILNNNSFIITEPKSFDPDFDFTEMCKSDIFIQSFGGYSLYISKVVNKNNGTVFFINDFDN